MTEGVLFITFISIFIATAVLTLISLPGWIKIEEKYKKQLFKLLIVEVIGLVTTLGYNVLVKDVKINPNNWIALDYMNGKLLDSIQFKHGLYENFNAHLTANKQEILKRQVLQIEKKEDIVLVKSSNDICLGQINEKELSENKLYEDINLKDEIRLTFVRNENNTWETKGQQIFKMTKWPFEIGVKCDNRGFFYTVKDKKKNTFIKERGILDNIENNEDRAPFLLRFDNTVFYVKVLAANFNDETIFDIKKLVMN